MLQEYKPTLVYHDSIFHLNGSKQKFLVAASAVK